MRQRETLLSYYMLHMIHMIRINIICYVCYVKNYIKEIMKYENV